MIEDKAPEGTVDLAPEQVQVGNTILDEEGSPFVVRQMQFPSSSGGWLFTGEDDAQFCEVPRIGMLVRRIMPPETALTRLTQVLHDRGRRFDPVNREWSRRWGEA